MEALITNQSELRNRGFRALAEALGWVNAVRFLRQYDPGSGNYTEKRRTLLPDWDASTLIRNAKELQKARESGAPEETDQDVPGDPPVPGSRGV